MFLKRHFAKKLFTSFLILLFIVSTGFIIYAKFGIRKEIDLSLIKTGNSEITKIYIFDRKEGIININAPKELSDERIFLENREWCSIDNIPENLKNAFIAIEDHKFYEHNGVNWQRTAKALASYLVNFGKASFGGSTITQQLVKNLTGDDMVTPKRKLEEIFRAQNLEKNLSKDEILESYLNVVYLSQNCYGIQSASKLYFSKNVDDLTLAECASLASIVKNPTKYDPYKFPENNKNRRKIVLNQMLEQKMISKSDYETAVEESLAINSNLETEKNPGVYSWFTEKLITDVKNDLISEYNLSEEGASVLINRGGLKIYSTMDEKVQKSIENVLENYILYLKPQDGKYPEASCVILDPLTSDILGIVGGVGTKSANKIFNRATDAKRPLGSVIKPLSVYAPGIELKKFTYSTVFDDVPIKKENGFWPHNANNKYMGLVSLNYALEHSLNTVSVKALEILGTDDSYSFCKNKFKINLIDEDKNVAPLALGQLTDGESLLNVTNSYSSFANGGFLAEPRSYYYVTDNDGNVILSNDYKSERIISEECSSIMNIMLKNVVENGTAKALKLKEKFNVAAKTGTSGENKDKWIVGYTPYYVCGVWVGYDIPISMDNANMFAINIFDEIMNQAHEGKKEEVDLFSSENIIVKEFCVDSGKVPTDACNKDLRMNRIQKGYFIKGTEPISHCDIHKEFFINMQTGMITGENTNSLLKRKVSLVNYERSEKYDEFLPFDKKYLISSRVN